MSRKTKSGVKKLARVAIAGFVVLTLGVVEVRADIITWHYQDDFNDLDTRKAENDSYSHSLFRAEEPNVPPWPEPELQSNLYYAFYHDPYWYDEPLSVLLFTKNAAGNEPAFLAYAFPLDSELVRVDSGTVGIKIPMTCPPCLDIRWSGVLCELSEDGIDWTTPEKLYEGYSQIPLLPSNNSSTHIRFSGQGSISGQGSMLGSLSVEVIGPERVKTLSADLNNDGIVNFLDLSILMEQWLMTESWYIP